MASQCPLPLGNTITSVTSLGGMVVLVNALKEGATLDVKVRWRVKEAKVMLEETVLEGYLSNQPIFAQDHLLHGMEAGSWLTTMPN